MRFAHLSDLHALDLQGVSPLRFFNKRLAGWINLMRKRKKAHPVALLDALCDDVNAQALDHVVITGDLSNLSLESELQRARAAIDRITLGPREVSVIPGNHDVYVWEAYFRRHFDRIFAPYALGDDAPEGSLPTYPFVRVRGDVAFIGTSTARPSPPPLADGRLGARQLQAVEERLLALRGKFRVLLIHHPPLPQSLDLLRALRDRKALHAVLRRVGCELVLHGHEHRDLRGELPGPDGPIPIIGVGSSTYDDQRKGAPRLDRRARYNIYTVERSPATASGFAFTIEQRVHDPAAGGFVAYAPAASALAS
jgi:3',5'-cyclic AMP phosphodiesterase CpdA